MHKNKQALICRFLVALLTVICVLSSIYFGFRRNIYHIDEVWSYSLGNSTQGKYWFDWWENGAIPQDPAPEPEEFFDHWQKGEFFKNYITVQKGEEFRYDIAYHYQATDVSPPLYYAMIHTICSFFPEQFSKWFGLIPNIAFFALCIPVLYFIAGKLFKTRLQAFAATAFWALSRAAFSDASLIRMYMLATFLCVVSFALHLEILKEREKLPLVPLTAIFFVNVIGFLTQNYVYVYTFFMAVVICFMLYVRRKIKQMLVFGITELLSVGTAFLIFPAAIKQMTKSVYGERSVSNIFNIFNFLDGAINDKHGFWGILLKNAFGLSDNISALILDIVRPIVLFLLVFGIIFFLYVRFLLPKNKCALDEKSKAKIEKVRSVISQKFLLKLKTAFVNPNAQPVILLFLVTILTGHLIQQASPEMGAFRDRYFFMIYPMSFLGVAWVIFKLIGHIVRKKEKLMLAAEVLLVVIAVWGNFSSKNWFLFYENGQKDLQSILTGQTCFILTNNAHAPYVSHNHAIWLQDAEKAYFSQKRDQQLIDNISECQSCYIFINKEYGNTDVVLNQLAGQHKMEDIGCYYLSESYYEIYYLS